MAQLGDLLRASLRHGAQPKVPLSDELTFLDDFLAIESARFEDRLRVTVRADDDVLPLMVPSFLLQPIVENAIRHGVGTRLSGGHVEVIAARNGSGMHISVRDDGVGLPVGWSLENDAGIGLKNVAARLEHLYGRKNLLRVNPIPTGGVEVTIELPVP
jgi:two-component system, LytTR family, sensor kinase